MWPDNETEKDYLNFSGVSNTVAEIIVQSQGRPTSIGVSGAWGVGKSSMIKLIRASLKDRAESDNLNFLFVEFNAWLYQGYDDARAALLEVIASKLVTETQKKQSGINKARELIARVNWFRVARLGTSLFSLISGDPSSDPTIENLVPIGTKLVDQFETPNKENVSDGASKPLPKPTPPQAIHAIRESFEHILSELNIKLIVLIDDLDRCLPHTTISTLEAIRLFLFLENTAFVIAADEAMIKYSVQSHFDGVDDTLVTNYFDKLIQVPIRVPPLGTQEVRAYMMLLFIENSELAPCDKEQIRRQVCEQLAQTWRGQRVDRAFMQSIYRDLPDDLVGQLDTADRLAPLMASTSQIGGNPRLIKRFLNALSIRMTISNAHGVGVDEAVLAKILLFERCAMPAAYDELVKSVNNDNDGKPRFLDAWEKCALAGESVERKKPWDDSFIHEWLTVPPSLADIDLRGVLYVSREHAPLITAEDRLSSEGAELLTAILEFPQATGQLTDRLASLPRPETTIIMDRILERARQEQEWGVPPILEGGLAVAAADPSQGQRLAAFLSDRPHAQIKPSIIPKIGDQLWVRSLFDTWYNSPVSRTVKAAITRERKRHGHL